MKIDDWDALELKTHYMYRRYLFRTMPRIPPIPDNELAYECAKYGMDVVWHEGVGMYMVGRENDYYGVIGADWRDEGIDLPSVVAELAVFGPFGVDP